MSINRKDFLKKVCISGACMCGFSSILFSKDINDREESTKQEEDKKSPIEKEWIVSLLQSINSDLDKDSARKIIKETSVVHYKDLKMDDLLAEYKNDLEKFIVFLQSKWEWKIDYDKKNKVLIADENKNFCVCPIIAHNKTINTSAICYCSEGFAEKMFSLVSGVPVKAEVISSVRRGDKTCKYKIVFSNT